MIAPYIALFTVTSILVGIAASPANRSRFVRWFFSTAAIVLVSVFAGVRDFEVGGPDVLLYGNRVFRAMTVVPEVTGILDYAIARNVSGEVGYYFLNWAVTRFTHDPHVFYTLLTAFSSTCVLIAIMLLREYGPAVVMWLTYCLTAYVEGFNLLRQTPALSLGVLGIALVLRNRYRTGLIVGAAGLLFHNSAVVFFVMWAVAVYLKTRRDNLGRSVAWVLVVGVLSLTLVAPALEFLSSALGDSKYEQYLTQSARGGRAFGVDALYRLVPIGLGVWALLATREKPPLLRKTPARTHVGVATVATLEREVAPVPARSETEVMARRAVIVVLALLTLEMLLLPVREISYPFYRLLAYIGYLRIIGYGLIVGLVRPPRIFAAAMAVAFSAAYFVLIILGRNEATYSSVILDSWLRSL